MIEAYSKYIFAMYNKIQRNKKWFKYEPKNTRDLQKHLKSWTLLLKSEKIRQEIKGICNAIHVGEKTHQVYPFIIPRTGKVIQKN